MSLGDSVDQRLVRRVPDAGGVITPVPRHGLDAALGVGEIVKFGTIVVDVGLLFLGTADP